MPVHTTSPGGTGLLLVGDGPGAAELARVAASLGVSVATAAAVRGHGPGLCVLAPRALALLPAWWTDAPMDAAPDETGTVVIVGGGHTGVEAALHWSSRVGRVLLVEAAGRLLPEWDDEVAAHLDGELSGRGVAVLVGRRVVALQRRGQALAVRLRRRGSPTDTEEVADLAVPALGLRPDVAGLGLERTRALADRLGFLQVDSRLETAEPGLYALGAALALPLTPAVVARQALVVASCAAGLPTAPVRYNVLPRVIAGECAALTAGLTAAGARERGFRVAGGRAGDARAWVACVRDAETGAALGVHAAGPGAAALESAATALLEGTVAMATPGGGGPDADGAMLSLLAAAHAAATKESVADG